MRQCLSIALLCFVTAAPAAADCYETAGARYRINAQLLRAIAHVESSGRPGIVAQHENGEDLCEMQISDQHLPKLSEFGISRSALLSDRCICVSVGAWILAGEISRVGSTWLAVGQYHTGPAASNSRKRAYAEKVHRAYQALTQRVAGQ